MRTIKLSTDLPAHVGGRPRKLGSIDFDEISGQMGVFIGYDREHKTKVVVDYQHLGELLGSKGYKIEFKAHIKPLGGTNHHSGVPLAVRLIPSGLRNKIASYGTPKQQTFDY